MAEADLARGIRLTVSAQVVYVPWTDTRGWGGPATRDIVTIPFVAFVRSVVEEPELRYRIHWGGVAAVNKNRDHLYPPNRVFDSLEECQRFITDNPVYLFMCMVLKLLTNLYCMTPPSLWTRLNQSPPPAMRTVMFEILLTRFTSRFTTQK